MKHYSLWIIALLCLVTGSSYAQRTVTDLSGEGWHLWQDKDARWQTEEIFMTPVDLTKMTQRTPTKGWDILTSNQAMKVKVPGGAEEYLQTVSGPEGDIHGVTWWTRDLAIPSFKGDKRIILKFGSIRSRAEIFINKKLVDYQIVDNTPFEIDITPYVKAGETVQLAVRITDAGGNYDWRDGALVKWGDKTLPPGHAFGGVTGKVSMEVCDPVYTSDIYMQNTPTITTANAILTVSNTLPKSAKRNITVIVSERNNPSAVLFKQELKNKELKSGDNTITIPVSAPDAKLWDVENPNLYICNVELADGSQVTDRTNKRFGFRWFEASGIGENAIFKLNGKRIVLRSAISWSFWPINGIYPTDELAERQVRVAKELGLNMLNFHRFIGSPNVLDFADELGLLYFEEPGGYRLNPDNDFLNANLREKVMRMVKRDRSHPSLVIFNMMNESGAAVPEKLRIELQDMRDMHKLDPSRYILRTSAWAAGDYIDDQAKIHIRPYDTTVYWNGWYDYHHAGGPAVWNEGLYKNPQDYYNNTTNAKEIVFYGEEGALSSPPRLELNKKDLEKSPYKGWDGREFLRWYDEFEKFIDDKGLRKIYPTVDALNVAMGSVSFEHQGRKIESARINNYTDAYVVNGWESELIENFSGIVDCFRYPKSDPAIISRYNRPLYVSVKPRQQVTEAGGKVTVDFYIVNEKDVKGPHELRIYVTDPMNRETYHTQKTVNVTGGETYGELLAEGIEVPVSTDGGMYTIYATIVDGKQHAAASGHDQVLAVNLASNKLAGNGAVWEDGAAVQNFLNGRTQNPVKAYADNLGKLDWVIVTRPPKKEQLTMVPSESLRSASGANGLDAVYYMDMDFKQEIHREIDNVVNLSAIEGATPNPHVPTIAGYSILWSGTVVPPVSGEYTFIPQSNDRSVIELLVDGKKLYEIKRDKTHIGDGKITLEKGKPAKIEIRFQHARSNARCRLEWAVPNDNMPNPQQLMERAKNDGTNVYILENADQWAEFIAPNSKAVFKDKFYVGTNWLGGVMFNKQHPVFQELPSNNALNWPYQALIHTGVERMGLVMEGEELLIGAYHTYPMQLGTAMGAIPVGKGTVVFSTLDIYGNIVNPSAAGLVAQKLVLNMIDLKK